MKPDATQEGRRADIPWRKRWPGSFATFVQICNPKGGKYCDFEINLDKQALETLMGLMSRAFRRAGRKRKNGK